MIRPISAALCLTLASGAHATPNTTANANGPYDGADWLGAIGSSALLGALGGLIGLGVSVSISDDDADAQPLGSSTVAPLLGLLAGAWGGAELYGYATERDGSTVGALLGATLGLGVTVGTAALLDDVVHADTVGAVIVVGGLLLPAVGATFGYSLGLDDPAVSVPTPGVISDGAGGAQLGLHWGGRF